MNVITIPLKSMRRKPTKTILLLLVFSLGVMSIVALYQVSLVVGYSLEKKLSAYGANIVVKPMTEKLSVSYGGFHMGDMLYDIQEMEEAETTAAIQSIALKERISVVAPKFISVAKVREMPTGIVGVRWKQELGIKSYWATNGTFPQKSTEVLLGFNAAKNLGLGQGDTARIFGKQFTVSGILYETGSDDDGVILMDLGELQRAVEQPGAVSFVEVAALCAGCPIEDIVGQIKSALPAASVVALQNVVNQRMSSIHFVQKLALFISLVILVTASAMVGLSMLSAVNERKKDIGILRSLGYARSKIFFVFCFEAAIIGLLAGTVGYFSGLAASAKALQFLSMAEGMSPVFSLSQLLVCVVLFPAITVLAAIYPSWKGASIEPSEALITI